jgi:crotonobetainyl-CoA:carnitine CoA-transferase CaiB-like acyl-CoA transferase
MSRTSPRGPLEGLRVIDCSRGTAGTRATGILADYGAEVLWIEPPGGDPWREQLALPYSVFNRGKQSVVLDLGSEDGHAKILGLLEGADAFVESWRPGVASRLGLDATDLRKRMPGLITCSISAFGQEGRYRDIPGHEALVHALIGTMGEQAGHREGPIFEAIPFASIGAAYLAVIGVLGALIRREADGRGRSVETSLMDGALSYLSMFWGESDKESGGNPPIGTHRLITRSFLCADGTYLGVHSGAVGAFGRLMQVLGLDDRIPPSESGVDMGLSLTLEQQQILATELEPLFAARTSAEWAETLLAADVCAIPHLAPTQVFDEPQARHNEMVVEVDDPTLGRIEQVAPPAKMSLTPGRVRGPAPTVGQHTDHVLSQDVASTTSERKLPGGSIDERPLLADIKILDLGAFYAGPYTSRLLADLGAEVIKLEPMAGDPVRGLAPAFRSASAGKRGLCLNLKDPEAERALHGLLEWCDVVHHNMRPGSAERLGVGFEQVRAIKPDIVYLYAPGWGSSGPDMNRQSFAPMMSGYTGCGLEVAGQFNPPLFPAGNEDPGNGLLGAVGILMGVLHRRLTGEGQYIENPQLNATMAHTAHMVRRLDGTVLGAMRLDPMQYGFEALERLYETADGWICIVATRPDQTAALGRVMNVEISSDDCYAIPGVRPVDDDLIAEGLAKAFRTRTTREWLTTLAEAGVPAAEPVPHNCTSFLRDPENQRSGRVAEASHPVDGHIRELARLVRVSDAMDAPHRLAPAIGEHTDEILGWLGYSADQIRTLKERGSAR